MVQRVQRGRKGWSELVRRQEESGQSARAFCVGESINLTSFYKWRGRILEEARAASPKAETHRNEFFEVGRIGGQDILTASDGVFPMEVRLDFGNGFTLTVRRG
jgi:hypothetical protein